MDVSISAHGMREMLRMAICFFLGNANAQGAGSSRRCLNHQIKTPPPMNCCELFLGWCERVPVRSSGGVLGNRNGNNLGLTFLQGNIAMEVINAAKPYVDVISFQDFRDPVTHLDEWYGKTGRPVPLA